MARAKVPCHKLITNATVIANITNPANWISDTYIWPLTGLFEWDYYYDPATTYHYQFDGSTLYFIDTGVAIIQPAVFVPTYADLPAVWAISTLYVVESDINYWWAASNYYRDTWTSSYVYIWYAWASVDDNVKSDATDPVSWFLDSKVDINTLSVNTITHELELHNLITNPTVISDITNESRWSAWFYGWPLSNITENQYYYDSITKYHYQFDGTNLYRIYSPAWPIASNMVLVNTWLQQIVGKQYQSFADAFSYIATQTCDSTHPWTVSFSWYVNESISVPQYITISGNGRNSSIIEEVQFINEWTQFWIENNIRNCTIKNYISLWSSSINNPVVATTALTLPYYPDTLFFTLVGVPTYWAYTLKITIWSASAITWSIPYNADAAAIQAAINALWPDYSAFTVSWLWFPSSVNILCTWAPAGNCDIAIISNTTDVWIKTSKIYWSKETSTITFDNIPTSGIYRLVFNYMWTNYYSASLNYDDNVWVIVWVVRWLLLDVENASWWTFRTWHLDTAVYQSSPTQMLITYTWARWDLWWEIINVDNDPMYYTLQYSSGAWNIYANMREVNVVNAFIQSWWLTCEDCIIVWWDYSLLTYLYIKNSRIVSCTLPENTKTIWGLIAAESTTALWWDFYMTWITWDTGSSFFAWTWSFHFYQCVFDNVEVWYVWSTDTYNVFFNQCDIDLLTQNTWANIRFIWTTLWWHVVLGWTYSNVWDYFSDIIGLWVNNMQDAIIWLHSKFLPVTWSWSPVWIIVPRYVWDRYIDMTWPTVYTAYGLNNTEWIS